jgi:hypothetical protein
LRQSFDDPANVVKPNELALDGSYALKLSDLFSMAVAGRYIRSNLRIPDATTDARAANTFAFDVAGFFQSEEFALDDFNGRYRLGFNFQNLGPKISYDNDQSDLNSNFIPANMRLGGGFDFILDEYNKVSLNVEAQKLLVPTPQVGFDNGTYNGTDMNNDGTIDSVDMQLATEEYKRINWVSGIFRSFGDAPGGFSEELREVSYSVGAEYNYQDAFARPNADRGFTPTELRIFIDPSAAAYGINAAVVGANANGTASTVNRNGVFSYGS